MHLDVTNENSWHAAVDTAVRLYGKLNILVNNAGIYIRKRIEETTEDDLDQILAVNVKGGFFGVKHALPAMRRAGGGSIINISSVAGLVGNPHGSPIYTTSKGAVRLFTKATAMQHARENIRCNSIHPGPIDTAMLDETAGGRSDNARACPARPVGTVEVGLRRAVSGLG